MSPKLITGAVLLLFILIFILQNATIVTVNVLFWKFSLSRSLMILFVLAAGLIIGWIGATVYHHNKQKKASTPARNL